jgi:signal transduction histidine kinase
MYGDFPEIAASVRQALTGETVRATQQVGELWFETHYAPIVDERGETVGAMGVSVDVTDREQLEAQLRQAAKMEAIGRLAGGIAHDFNNILTVIAGNAEIGLFTLEEDHPLRDRLEAIQQATAHAHDLTSRLLAFSRKQVAAPRVLDLEQVLDGLEPMLSRLLGEKTRFTTLHDARSATVRADPGQVEQILVNLVVNAHDAMPEGGEICVRTDICSLDEGFLATRPYAEPGTYVRLRVTDEGEGMDEEVLGQVFEPFFTTKSQGTGLGLSTVYGIVKQAGGFVEVESKPGEGTVVDVYLPHIAGVAEDEDVIVPVSDLPGGAERVVLVEDEEAVRELTAEMLSDLGYSVTSFGDPLEAQRFCEERSAQVDLLLTDVVMPGLNGAELARRLRERHPGVKVLFMSGYTDDVIADHGVLDPEIRLLAKPFKSAELARMVRETLGAPGS